MKTAKPIKPVKKPRKLTAKKVVIKKPAEVKDEAKPVGLFELVFGWMWRK